jgi:pyruvate/2-oxoglutarate dehydrogenase complex dihydrolipoamide dehydrogenase (E3) component
MEITCKAVVLAMGCRERNRGNIGTAGTRPSGIFTAGLAQRLLNIEGYMPGKRIVIVGSGDIGLIMARRLTWAGAEVIAVIEIMPFPSGITRNIVQCLNDFDIPLYLSHIVSKIHGKDRVEKVTITPLSEKKPDSSKSFDIECDTILFSVGLLPETEIAEETGIKINYDTHGPYVDANLMTTVPGVFACGNVLHVHDLVDFVSEESERCGIHVYEYINNQDEELQYSVMPGSNIKYVIPNKFIPGKINIFFMRSLIVKNNAELIVKLSDNIIKKRKLKHVQPSEMISVKLAPEELKEISENKNMVLQFSIK